jgi:hypothetical protein
MITEGFAAASFQPLLTMKNSAALTTLRRPMGCPRKDRRQLM